MADETQGRQRQARGLGRRIVSILLGLVATLLVGAVADRVTSPEWLAGARQAQQGWIDAIAQTSPLRAGELYWTELQSALSGDTSHGGLSGTVAPGCGTPPASSP